MKIYWYTSGWWGQDTVVPWSLGRKGSWRRLPSWKSLGTRHPRWRPSSGVSVPRLMLPAWWPGGPGITRLLDIFPCAIPSSSLSLGFFLKRQHATQQAPVMCQYCHRHHGCQDRCPTPSICAPRVLPIIRQPHEHPQWNLLSATIILWWGSCNRRGEDDQVCLGKLRWHPRKDVVLGGSQRMTQSCRNSF